MTDLRSEDNLETMSDRSEELSTADSEDLAFVEMDTLEWKTDDKLLSAPADSFRGTDGVQGSTAGLRRFSAMINSIEQRAMRIEALKAQRKA